MKHDKSFGRHTRCIDGRLMRHDPQPDDPSLETDIGKCPECDGKGCLSIDAANAYDDDNEYDDCDEDFEFDCHLGPDGQCGKAGSEECDWECPLSHSEFYAGSAAWNKKHGVKP